MSDQTVSDSFGDQLLSQERIPGVAAYPLYWALGELFSRAVYTAIPLGLLLGVRHCFRTLRGEDVSRRAVALSTLVVLVAAVVLSAFPRADYFHISSIFPVVLLMLFALFQGRERPPGLLLKASVILGLLVCSGLAILHRSYLTFEVNLPRARVMVDPANGWMQPLVHAITAEIPPGEPLFVYGHEADIYFLTERFFPWQFSQLYPGQAGGDGGKALVEKLVANPPRYIVQGLWGWPGVPAIWRYAPDLNAHVFKYYEHDEQFFDRHPMPLGVERPPKWVVSMLRRKGSRTSASHQRGAAPPSLGR